jgi:hypothetical protein
MGVPFVSVDKNDRNRVMGYAAVLRCSSGFAVAPLIAENSIVAEDLIKEICEMLQIKNLKKPFEAVIAFTLDDNPIINTVMEKYFPKIMYECTRMYRMAKGIKGVFDMSKVYAFNTYERC